MHRILLLSLLLSTPAVAQTNAPMVIIGGDQPAAAVEQAAPAASAAPAAAPRQSSALTTQQRLMGNFPEWAVSQAGSAVGGAGEDVERIPDAAPAAPSAPAGAVAANPKGAALPDNPTLKLWPMDTVPIFLQSCVGYRPQLLMPCNCVIRRLMPAMGHDEFLKLTARGTLEQDPRLQSIRAECLTEAANKMQQAR